jgi:hypothetical protein
MPLPYFHIAHSPSAMANIAFFCVEMAEVPPSYLHEQRWELDSCTQNITAMSVLLHDRHLSVGDEHRRRRELQPQSMPKHNLRANVILRLTAAMQGLRAVTQSG